MDKRGRIRWGHRVRNANKTWKKSIALNQHTPHLDQSNSTNLLDQVRHPFPPDQSKGYGRDWSNSSPPTNQLHTFLNFPSSLTIGIARPSSATLMFIKNSELAALRGSGLEASAGVLTSRASANHATTALRDCDIANIQRGGRKAVAGSRHVVNVASESQQWLR